MKPGQSKRHHYIPQFFIKNFADDDGLLFVYNKEKDSFLRNKQSPKSLFFDNDRNTVSFSGHNLDNLEQFYGDLDNNLAKDYLSVIKNENATPEEVVSIILLANLIRWRIPKSDLRFNELKNDLTQEDLQIKISIKNQSANITEDAISHIENSDFFKETKRILLSIIPLLNSEKLLEMQDFSFLQMESKYPSLLGDCPILMNSQNDKEIGDFIFPLSSEVTFIYKAQSKRIVKNTLFFFHRDLSILHNSNKLIGCKSKDHLEKIVTMYKEIIKDQKISDLEKYTFNFVE